MMLAKGPWCFSQMETARPKSFVSLMFSSTLTTSGTMTWRRRSEIAFSMTTASAAIEHRKSGDHDDAALGQEIPGCFSLALLAYFLTK